MKERENKCAWYNETTMAQGTEVLYFVLTVMEKQAVAHHTSIVFLGPLILSETLE